MIHATHTYEGYHSAWQSRKHESGLPSYTVVVLPQAGVSFLPFSPTFGYSLIPVNDMLA